MEIHVIPAVGSLSAAIVIQLFSLQLYRQHLLKEIEFSGTMTTPSKVQRTLALLSIRTSAAATDGSSRQLRRDEHSSAWIFIHHQMGQ